MNNVKYKLSHDLIESLPEGAQLYADPEVAFDALVTKVAELEKKVATLEEGTGATIESIETVSVLEGEIGTSTDNVVPIGGQLDLLERPVDPNVSGKHLSNLWDVTPETISKLSARGYFKKVGRGLYDRKSVEQWVGGPLSTLVNSKKAAKHYGVTPSTANLWGHRGRIKAVDFGLSSHTNFRFDLSYKYSE